MEGVFELGYLCLVEILKTLTVLLKKNCTDKTIHLGLWLRKRKASHIYACQIN